MKISRLNPYNGTNKTKAFFDAVTAEGIELKGFTLVDGSNGLFVSPPREKGKDGKYFDRVILPKELKDELTAMAIAEYEKHSVKA
ncbi:MAG: septation protein SpoVG family protein [Ignavibacteriaceae bacterium]|jgi:stage V sporulation protein G